MSESSEGLFDASLPQKVAALSLSCMASLPVMVMPFIFGALIEHHQLSTDDATYATTAEIAMIALASLFVSVMLRFIPPRKTVLLALVVVAVSQVATLYCSEFTDLLIARAFVGLGEGFCMGLGFAFLAQMVGGARLLAYASGVVAALSLLSFVVIPALEPHLGYSSAFWFMFGVTAICVPLATFMPKTYLKQIVVEGKIWEIINVRSISLFSVALLASSGSNTLWLYFEQVGQSVNMSLVDIGNLGISSSMLTLLVPFLANFIYARTKSILPIMVACVISAVAAYFYAGLGSWIVFYAVIFVMSFSYVFLLAYVRMFAAYLDASGRTTAAVSGADSLGMVVGPLVAAVTLSITDDFSPLNHFGFVAQALCVVPCLVFLIWKGTKRAPIST